ncbi:MAG: lactaldehyde reductase [Bacilli bacterium]|nr:lactaldehyde reductase [Bacilli bacterium]
MANRIILNETSYFGFNSREVLSTEIIKRKYKKVLVMTDKNLIEAGVAKKVTDVLDNAGIEYRVFSNIKANPTVSNVKEGVEACAIANADVIVSVGGGSVIDTSKAVAIIMNNPEFSDVVSLDGVADTKNKSLPIIALPTTSGTAAEVTINYVITDEKRVKKMVCVDPNDIPVLAIIDTELMLGMPKLVAASTGMDALTHAMEGYITKGAWEMSDMFHLEAIKLIYQNLEKAVLEKDVKAVENVALAQYVAGMGFSNVGLGIVHSLAHSLGALYDTPHGVANALLLPTILKYNGSVCANKFVNMANVMGLETNGLKEEECVDLVVNAVIELSKKIGIPQTLREINAKEEDLPWLAEQAFNDVCTPGNPRETSVEDVLELYKKVF